MNLKQENTLNESEVINEIIDTYQNTAVKAGKNSVKLVRDPRGRFVSGNQESVGNKGGRPRKWSAEEWLADPLAFDLMMKKALVDDNEKSFKILADLFR